MDAKQQIRLNFLDEAVDYFDCMESNLLGLADSEINPQQVDIVLRAAHSVKGGAAMMSFNLLSQVAHRLEDFLKILRVRYGSNQISTEVETLLLQSVDSLRYISDLNRQDSEIDESGVRNLTQPIFEQLREHLGDLEVADENALLSQDEDFDPALLVFEEGVDGVLDRFETQLEKLGIPELAQELATTTQELIGFGTMANLEPFILLCQSIQEKAANLSQAEIPPLANQALQTWRRSHALVIRGSIEKLPSSLEEYTSVNQDSNIAVTIESQTLEISQDDSIETEIDPLEDSSLDLGGLQSAFEATESETQIESEIDPLEDSSLDLGGLKSAFETTESETQIESEIDPLEDSYSSLDLGGLKSAFETTESETQIESEIDPLEDSSLDLGGLQSAFEATESETQIESEIDPLEDSSLDLGGLKSAFETTESETQIESEIDPLEDSSLDLGGLKSAFETTESETQIESEIDPLEDSSLDLGGLQSAFETTESETQIESEIDPLEDSSLDLGGLKSAFETTESETQIESEIDPLEDSFLNLTGLQSAFDLDTSEETPSTIQLPKPDSPSSPSLRKNIAVEQMVRVPASQLKQFNTLFEQLILNRNTIHLRLQQFQNVLSLMSQRMSQMERSNTQFKQWYDRASVEGLIGNQEQPLQNSVSTSSSNSDRIKDKRLQTRFDALEMDHYSDIHLICQEQIETIVQLQEVSTDIELGLQEINQAVRELNYTTKSMQGNVNRTQMLPFAEVVKRFPRVIRDLNLQFNKKVNYKIVGENTLIDRTVIEALSDPLMHLFRNAFDHGIEDTATRIAAGKHPSGTITIQASNQGTYTVITLADDGGGISVDKIRDRVVQMGVPRSEVAHIPEAELLDFIFEPGFSTAEKVTELSGRGVGMDVVRTNLQEIRGDVQVATTPGKGTTFTIRIPFTLSILRVAVIEQAGIIFAIPANSIRELLPLTSELVETSENSKYIQWNQIELPLVEIEKTLIYNHCRHNINLTGNPAIDETMALVVGNEKFLSALQISRFWYEQESTIRSIDCPVSLPSGIMSSVVFGDGKVIPLVDPTLLIEECLEKQSNPEQFNTIESEACNLSTSKTILVVDDSINVRRYLTLTLEKAGYRVEQAKDGQEAVDKLLGGLTVQAVVCDIEMPRLDGYGVLEEIKGRPEFAYLPMAMLTSRSNEKHRKLAMNLGATAYFSKPYNEQELLDSLTELLA